MRPVPLQFDVTPKRGERFWAMVTRGDGCWEWLGARDNHGYGSFCVQKRLRRAHRVAYVLIHGSIPHGLYVLHRCDNPGCVRPDHLWLGSGDDNDADRDAKGRNRPPYGERNGFTKLTNRDADEIRRLWDAGHKGVELARIFGSSPPAISAIVNRKTFRFAGNVL